MKRLAFFVALIIAVAGCRETPIAAGSNSLLVIVPYRHAGTWVFDDPGRGLKQEPFVAGIPRMIDRLVADIPNADGGFRLIFSAQEFPGYTHKLVWKRKDGTGNWYYCPQFDAEGWLCPALLQFFREAPREICVKAEPVLAATAATGHGPLGQHYDFSKVACIMALKQEYVGAEHDDQYFAPLHTTFSNAVEVAKLCGWIRDARIDDDAPQPFIGHLCHLAMLDAGGRVIAMVSLLNWNCVCRIYGGHRDAQGRILADYDNKGFSFYCRPLAEAVHARLSQDDPAYMQALRKHYAGKESLEDLLYYGRRGRD